MTAEEKMTRLLLGASTDLRKIYNQLVSELAKVTAQSIEAVTPGEFYNIARHCTPAQRKKVDALLQEYHDMLLALVRQGVTHAVAQSATLTAQLFRGYVQLTGEQTERWRKQAASSFIDSRMRRDGGLSLSDRVWNYTEQTKAEFELAVSQAVEKGIAAGMDAERLGRQVRQYLNNPDMMYRRYHRKKVMADGTKKDIVEWRRRRVGPDGKVHFVKEDLARVGTGVYRSARQNALRLVITETNMAYNAANSDRWSQQPFVLGIRIRLSGNHPEPDICDELQGDYPRTFQWRGWHPRCRCSQSPIMMDRESDEWKHLRSLPKAEYNAYQSPNLITSTPRAFNQWVSSHKDKLQKARERGKLPYFVRDNQKAVGQLLGWKEQGQAFPRSREEILAAAKLRHEARTAGQVGDILDRWDLRRYSDSQKSNFQEIEDVLGIKRGRSMDFEAANNGRGNIEFGEAHAFSVNCQSAVVAHELRLRGFPVTAQPNWRKGDAPDQLSRGTWQCWMAANGLPLLQPAAFAYQISPSGGIVGVPLPKLLAELKEHTQQAGRYHVSFQWKGKEYGHIVTMERTEDGAAHWYDPQTGKRDFFDKEYAKRIKAVRAYRVDNLLFNAKEWNVVRPIDQPEKRTSFIGALRAYNERNGINQEPPTPAGGKGGANIAGGTRVTLTKEIIEYRNKALLAILQSQSGAQLNDGRLQYSKKSLRRSLAHAKDVEEVDMFRYVAANANELKFVRKSALGEVKDTSNKTEWKNVQKKESRGVLFYNVYELRKGNDVWIIKTEVNNAGIEIPYNMYKRRQK